MLVLGGRAAQGAMLVALRAHLAGFDRLAIAVSYLQMSGWALLAPMIAGRTDRVRVVCTDQMGVTDPDAVRAMQAAGVAVRAYAGSGVYHPKLYVAARAGQPGRWLLGSANLSRSALVTGVEAGTTGVDDGNAALAWFDALWADPAQSVAFDAVRLAALDRAFAARLKGRLAYRRIVGKAAADPVATDSIEAAFGTIAAKPMPLNLDKGGSTVRTLRYIEELLATPGPLADAKAAGDMRRLGFFDDAGGLTPLGVEAAAAPDQAAIARAWIRWLRTADDAVLLSANPVGRLAAVRDALRTFWTFSDEVTQYFIAHATGAAAGSAARRVCQTIELLANTTRRGAALSLADVETLAAVLDATDGLPVAAAAAVREYLDNRGARLWQFADRVATVTAWRDSP